MTMLMGQEKLPISEPLVLLAGARENAVTNSFNWKSPNVSRPDSEG
jgi:hypothetical protein